MAKFHHGNLREALLTRASEIIEAGGIEALSLRGMARDLKVSATAPARHFKCRADLLRTLAMMGYDRATNATVAALNDAGDDPVTRLNAMAKAFVDWSLDNRALYTAIFHPDVSRQADEALKRALIDFAALVQTAIGEAQRAGWRQSDDPQVLFHHITALIRGMTANMSDPLYVSVAGRVDRQVVETVIDAMIPIGAGSTDHISPR
ncbi:hypothetical protein B7H23_08775 [Notoacmeibacter marinus]|uniref:HTH-type transcriptional regulator MT1864/Rv1816-like C-terminal domain-containing protein n=1 Tax=Notoacmeibacter marinus TaxID=1876515 RepID=A0A231UWB1_9HYPH|nr:WHG domain-containing protein [Notoacmeibacter marinus]OXT00249.1 hypothetical protein B7H23_08775 [Notoacmeibacter marinus]